MSQLIGLDSPSAKSELHWRITLILAVPLMALIAVPLSRVNPRQGRFAKILPALLLYLIYFLLQSSFKSAGAAGKKYSWLNFCHFAYIGWALCHYQICGTIS